MMNKGWERETIHAAYDVLKPSMDYFLFKCTTYTAPNLFLKYDN